MKKLRKFAHLTAATVLALASVFGAWAGVPVKRAEAATPWVGIVAPARATDWSTAGVTGGIPNRTTICTTLNPGATAAQINSAIASCPSGQVVQLGAGTFNLSGTIIMRNNVTLRGQGMSTILNFTSQGGSSFYWMGADVAIAFQGTGWSGSGDNSAPGTGGVPASTIRDWTGTNGQAGVYTQGATVLNLSSAPTGLAVGDTITLWQSDAPDSSLPNSGYFVSDKSGGNGAISWKGTSDSHDAGQTQRTRVTAINGSQVTIAAPGITRPTATWATARAPKAGWQSGMLTGAGLEYLRVVRTGSHLGTIGINGTADSWILGVGITGTISAANGITAFDSRNLTIKDSWMNRIFGGGGGQFTSYGITIVNTSHSLIENNILNEIESPVMVNNGSTGNVIAYNYENFTSGEGGLQQHEEGAAMNLYEGNSTLKFWMDTIHGNTQLDTMFRNHTFSTEAGADVWTYNRWYNMIGNVMAANTIYKTLSTDATRYTRWGGYCFRMGYGSQYEGPENHDPDDVGSSNQAHDPLVNASIMLWGNYCAAGNSVRWLASEVPSSDPLFPNPVPANQTLPASFYYTSRPSWWPTAKAWPPIGPDVVSGNIAGLGGHANTIPAQDCYTAAGGNIANFNPSTCYSTGTPPPPDTTPPSTPGNLQATPASSSQINLTWTASTDNVGVTGYKVERCQGASCTNFTQVAQPTATSHNDTGLTAATTYRYQVRATDAAGNNSGYSTIVSGTTQAATGDTTPPSVSITTPANAATVSNTTTVSANASDNVGVAGVQFLLDGANLQAEDTTGPYSINWDTTGATNGSHTLSARARDAAGNTTTSSNITVTVSNTAPPPTGSVSPDTSTQAPDLSNLTTGSWSHTTAGSNRYLIVGLSGWDDASSLTNVTVSYAGVPMTKLGGAQTGNQAILWGLVNPAAGTNTVSVTNIPAGFAELSGGSVSLTGVNQSAPTGTLVQETEGDASVNLTLATGDLGIDILYSGSGTEAPVVGAGGTTRINRNLPSNTTKWMMMATEPGSGAVTMSWTDAGGADFAQAAIPIKPAAAGDTTPPSTPTNLVASAVSSSQINLTWNASTDNVGVVDYEVQRCMGVSCTNFTQNYARPTGTSFSEVGLPANTTFRYQVRATDAAGNNSPYSTIVNATTQQQGSTKFTLGQAVSVFTGGPNLNVRSTPNGSILGTQANGNQGTVTGGPSFANNLWWWNINFTSGVDGWAAEDYLVAASTALTPTLNQATFTAARPSGQQVSGVQFYLDNQVFGAEDTTSPYTTVITFSNLSPGSHSLFARFRNSTGTTEDTETFTFTTQGPVAMTTAPTLAQSEPSTDASRDSQIASITAALEAAKAALATLLGAVGQ